MSLYAAKEKMKRKQRWKETRKNTIIIYKMRPGLTSIIKIVSRPGIHLFIIIVITLLKVKKR